jgi:probable phosphoglycerate mutase
MTDAAWLVRHGSTDWTGLRWCGRSDLPLSPAGRLETGVLAAELSPRLPAHAVIHTSWARRARETANALQLARAKVGGPQAPDIVLDKDLIEIDFGAVDGLTWPEIEETRPTLAARILARGPIDWPGGETAMSVVERIRRQAAVLERSEVPLVLVSHAAVLGALLAELAGAERGDRPLAPGRFMELRRDVGHWRVVRR